MGNGRIDREPHPWVIGILLMALVVRALIPVGFMPSSERPFTVQICPDGFPPQLLGPEHGSHHHHGAGYEHNSRDSHGGTHQHDPSLAEHCAFAMAAGMGPAPHGIAGVPPIEPSMAPLLSLPRPLSEVPRFRIPQPRAPPSLA
jgi:hypothetical protein